MRTANDLKVDIIATVAKMSNLRVLQRLYDQTQRELVNLLATEQSEQQQPTSELRLPTRDFEEGRVRVRNGVSKEQLFSEAGDRQPTLAEWQGQAAELKWEDWSLEELLAQLD